MKQNHQRFLNDTLKTLENRASMLNSNECLEFYNFIEEWASEKMEQSLHGDYECEMQDYERDEPFDHYDNKSWLI